MFGIRSCGQPVGSTPVHRGDLDAARPSDARVAPPAVSTHPPPGARGHALIELRGDLDLSTAQLLRRRLDEASATRHLVVDVSAVPFIDSTALGMLARAAVQRLEH